MVIIYIYYILSSTSHLGTHSSTVPTPTDKPVSVETWGMASPMVNLKRTSRRGAAPVGGWWLGCHLLLLGNILLILMVNINAYYMVNNGFNG